MSGNENVSLLHEYFRAMAEKRYDDVWRYYADDIVYEDAALNHVCRGLEEAKEFFLAYMPALDVLNRIEEVFAADEDFAIRWRMTGTHRADLPGMPATGKSFSIRGATVGRMTAGKITHNFDYWNLAELLLQLGFMPA